MATVQDLAGALVKGFAGMLAQWLVGVDEAGAASVWAPKVTAAVTPAPVPNLATGQVAAAVSAGTLVAARPTRRAVLIKNLDATIKVYIGPAAVTVANGMELKAGESVVVNWAGLIQVIAASGAPAVAYLDTYD